MLTLTHVSNSISLVSLILSTSVFIYITIHKNYVPTVQHTKTVHFQYDSKCKDNCTNPYAIINFNDRSDFYLSRGQSYRFVLVLDMPESNINWEQGVFMVRLRLIESKGRLLHDSARPAILKYKSSLTRNISAFLFWPLTVFNYKSEMQTLKVQLIDDHIQGAKFYLSKTDHALVEIIARDIQVYSARLEILVNLIGLSYYMYFWPLTSAIIGTTTIASFMIIISHGGTIYRLQL